MVLPAKPYLEINEISIFTVSYYLKICLWSEGFKNLPCNAAET